MHTNAVPTTPGSSRERMYACFLATAGFEAAVLAGHVEYSAAWT